MMRLIAYDIRKNKLRKKLADRLLEIGFTRVQKSVYLGKVKRKLLKQVIQTFESRLEKKDKLYVIPLRDSDLRSMYAFGFFDDLGLILDEYPVWIV